MCPSVGFDSEVVNVTMPTVPIFELIFPAISVTVQLPEPVPPVPVDPPVELPLPAWPPLPPVWLPPVPLTLPPVPGFPPVLLLPPVPDELPPVPVDPPVPSTLPLLAQAEATRAKVRQQQ